MKTMSDYEVKENEKDVEWLKFEQNEQKELVLLSRIIPDEGETWNDGLMAWYSQYSPPYTKTGWKTEDGSYFFGYPELDPNRHNELFPDEEYVNVGELLGFQKKDKFLLWVAETNSSELTPIVYSPPASVAKQLRNMEKEVKNNPKIKQKNLLGIPIVIKRDDTGKGATTYNVSKSFSDERIPLEEIEAIEFPASLESFITPSTVKAQIEDAIKNRALIEKITGNPLPFDDDGNVVEVRETATLEL